MHSMNIVLIFTNASRWNDLKDQFDVDEIGWNKTYKNIKDDKAFRCCVNTNNIASLQTLPDMSISDEGVYLIYDQIDKDSLSALLKQCNNDCLYILIHNGVDLNKINACDIHYTFRKGSHDGLPEHHYYNVFDILSDDKPDKTNRIIKTIFFKKAKEDFIHGCLTPNNNSKAFVNAHLTFQNVSCLTNILNDFMYLYRNHHGTPEFENKCLEINTVLNKLCK